MAYTQIKISVCPELAKGFKSACNTANASITSVLTGYISGYVHSGPAPEAQPGYGTRRRRRSAVGSIVKQLEKIKLSEESYRDNIPANLQCSSVYENADRSVSALDEALELLASAY